VVVSGVTDLTDIEMWAELTFGAIKRPELAFQRPEMLIILPRYCQFDGLNSQLDELKW